MSLAGDPRDLIAIVGMGVLMPKAGTLEAYWHNLVNGVDAITDVPEHRWDALFYDPEQAHRPDRLYCRRGGFVDELATFEPLKFGIMPNSIAEIEPDQLITLEVAAAAIADAGGMERLPDGDRVGVILGRGGILSPAQARYAQRVRMSSQVIQVLRELIPDLEEERLDAVRRKFDERLGPHQPEGTIGLVPNLTASRVANRLNLRGPAYTIDAACASSLIAVDQAITELRSGRLDAVLAGGVHHVHDISFWSVFNQLRALSRRGEIRPFHREADGLLIGEGTGIVVLKRLSDAIPDGDRIYAVIRGTGVSSDGRSASMFNPASAGQALAIQRAWRAAGLDPTAPDALGLLEAHGTGTPTGDAAELATLAEVFGPERGGYRPVIGSVKSMIGHTMPAAGIAGLIKAVLAVYHGVLLPTLHCSDPRPEMADTRFQPIDTARPWEGPGPRRAGVNAFGFGGINAHVIVEEAPEPARSRRAGKTAAATGAAVPAGAAAGTASVVVDEPDQVLWFAAPNPEALAALLDRDDAQVRAMGQARAGDRRPPSEDERCRLGVVDPTSKRLSTARVAIKRGQPWRGGRDIWFSPNPLLAGPDRGKIAFVFPGLEAEFAPRTKDIAAHFGLADREWSMADLGRHGAGLIEVGKLLNEALARIDITPDAVAGHSIGEWSAAAVSGQISTAAMDEFLELFNADSVEVSGYVFAAIGAGADRVTPLLSDYPGVVLSHDNAPAQSVVNGPEPEVDRLVEALRRDNILCQKLPFRSAFHTPVFEQGLRSIGAALRRWTVHPTRMPVWSTTLQAPFPDDEAQVNEIFIRHMMEPVWFRQLVAAMYDSGFRVFLQVGAGQLASLIGDNLRDKDHLAMPVNVSHRSGLNQLRRVATALWVEGATPNLAALDPAPSARPAASATVTKPATRRGPVIRLDLGGPLVKLGEGAAGLLGISARSASANGGRRDTPPTSTAPGAPADAAATVAAPQGTTAAAGTPAPTQVAAGDSAAALAALQQLSRRSSAAAELAALLRDTATGAVSVLDAAARRGLTVPPARPAAPPVASAATVPAAPTAPAARTAAPSPVARTAPPPSAARTAPAAGTTVASAAGGAGTSRGIGAPGGAGANGGRAHGTGANGGVVRGNGAGPAGNGAGAGVYRSVLRVSLETMPYLRDHCFFVQPDDWPNPEDRWPVVPATTVVHHMMEAVAAVTPGLRVVGVRDAKFNRWTIAAPPQDVEITVRATEPVRPGEPGRFAVTFGSFARATVEVAPEYPQPKNPIWRHDPQTERPPEISAEEMYAERLMFHGPLFQGVTKVHALGEMHVRGVVTTPAPPGALLDNALQLIGNWLITTQPFRTVALPVGLGHIRFYGPPPPVGKAFECVARVRSIDDAQLVADTQLIDGDRVWAEIEGAVDRRFDSHPSARPAERFPERYPMSKRQPEGWTIVFDAWTDLVTRSMAARGILGGAAYAEFEKVPPASRKQWLLGRIAAKDAVRFRQWEAGHTDVYPIELTVRNDPNGRPRVHLRPGRDLVDCDVSLAHTAEVGVAIAVPRPDGADPNAPGVGIDVVEITERPESTIEFALDTAERSLLDSLGGPDGADRALWFARFWAAKEAAAKAEGTGLQGDPKRLRVVAAADDDLTVQVGARTYRVAYREVDNPDDLPPRRYVVGWTWGPHTDQQ